MNFSPLYGADLLLRGEISLGLRLGSMDGMWRLSGTILTVQVLGRTRFRLIKVLVDQVEW